MEDNPIKEVEPWWKVFGTKKPSTATEAKQLDNEFERKIVTIPKHTYIDSLNKAVIGSGVNLEHFVKIMSRNEIREALGLNKEG